MGFLKSSASFLNQLANPIKDVQCFINYYIFILHLIAPGNGPHLRKLYLVLSLLVASGLHLLYLGLFPLDDYRRFLQYDAFAILLNNRTLNLFASSNIFATAYLVYVLFLQIDYSIVAFLSDILLFNQTGFFTSPCYKNKPVEWFVRRNFAVVLKLFHGLIPVMDLFLIYVTLHYIGKFVEYQNSLLPDYSPQAILWFIICLLGHLFSGLLYWTYMFSIAHILPINFSLCFGVLTVIVIKIKQNLLVLGRIIKRKRLLAYTTYRAHHLHVLGLFFSTNRLFGKAFFALILAFCPTNAYMTVLLINGYVAAEKNFFFLAFILYQFSFIFVIHLVLTSLTKHLHSPSKLLFQLMAISTLPSKVPQRTLRYFKVRLDRDIGVLHSNNRIGMTYGTFGLISLITFIRYLMLYGKFIMKSYTMML